jgi:hypothetical protein
MSAVYDVNSSQDAASRVALRISNCASMTLNLGVEPWGAVLSLLPHTTYTVTSLFEHKEIEAPLLESGVSLTVWPAGDKANRIYRQDGSLVWDDDDPSEVYRHFDDDVIASVLGLIHQTGHTSPEEARQLIMDVHHAEREDLYLLLIEHGVLAMDEQGKLFDPAQLCPPDA